MSKNRSTITHLLGLLLALAILVSGSACAPRFEGRPTAKPTLIPSASSTPTITLTPTLVPTVTPSPTLTLTPTATALPSATTTVTATPIPTRVASLVPLTAGGSRIVDWDYSYISRKELRPDDSVLRLSAAVAFQLLDRGIHRDTVEVLGQNLTIYYLRVSHTYKQSPIETRLILTGSFGAEIPIAAMPADGSAFINVRSQNSDEVFEPWTIQQDWLLPYEQRQELFDSILLQDFQTMLANLPDQVILLAHHPVVWSPDDYPQVKLNMTRLSAEAARLEPFFAYDDFDLLLGQTEAAGAWLSYLVDNESIPTAIAAQGLAFSAEYLVIIIP